MAVDSEHSSVAPKGLSRPLDPDIELARARLAQSKALAPSATDAVGTQASAPALAVVFDLDGTLTGPGTIGLFFLAAAGPVRTLRALPQLLADRKARKSGAMSFSTALARAGEELLEGLTEAQMSRAGERVVRWLDRLPGGWNKKAISRLKSLRDLGARVEIISGTFPWVAQRVAERWSVPQTSSHWIKSPNGWVLQQAMVEDAKSERLAQLKAQWPSEVFVRGYGNSFGDKAMLLACDEAWFVFRRNSLPEKVSKHMLKLLREGAST